MNITRCSTPKSDYVLCSQRWRSSIQSTKTRPGANCGSDHELLITKFRLKLKKVGKTARPFGYDLNQIPYDYTVEVRNRFNGVDRGFPGGLEVKASAWNVGDPGSIPGSQEDPLEKEMATHSSTLAWRIPWREEPGRLQSMGSQRVEHD